jgi:hypothetical protein
MLRPIGEVALEKVGKAPSPATQWRWLRKGVRGVRLNAQFVGGRWLTTDADFDAFTQGQTAKRLETDAVADTRQKLIAAGLL